VIATLGRFEELQASGQLERLVRSGARFAAKAMVLSAASDEAAIKIAVRRIGPALVFERPWEETGCRAVITALTGQRKHGFALERAVFLTVLLRFLFRVTLRRLDLAAEIYHLREPQRIPLVMSQDETRRLLAVASSLKVRVLLSLGYGCGLRAGEVVRLKVKHIDSAQKTRSGRSSSSAAVAASTRMTASPGHASIAFSESGRKPESRLASAKAASSCSVQMSDSCGVSANRSD
jgi:integrase